MCVAGDRTFRRRLLVDILFTADTYAPLFFRTLTLSNNFQARQSMCVVVRWISSRKVADPRALRSDPCRARGPVTLPHKCRLALGPVVLAGRPPCRARRVPRMAAGDTALIIQNKGGGHGEIGYHLALQLVKEKGMEVTVLHEGPNQGKPPHNAYGDLDAAGVKVIWCDDLKDSAACLGELGGASFGAVVDNWSKSPEDIAPYADAAAAWGVAHYAYVSSAGMYTPAQGEFGAITETCAVKSSGQRQARTSLPRPCLAPASPCLALPRPSPVHTVC